MKLRYVRTKNGKRTIVSEVSLAVSSIVFGPWALMLAVGVIHHEWIHTLPTIGFFWSFVIWMLAATSLRCAMVRSGDA